MKPVKGNESIFHLNVSHPKTLQGKTGKILIYASTTINLWIGFTNAV